jgi:hypothetical protein
VGILLKTSETRSHIKRDLLIANALALIGVLMCLLYLKLISVFEDEALQTVYALAIRPTLACWLRDPVVLQ